MGLSLFGLAALPTGPAAAAGIGADPALVSSTRLPIGPLQIDEPTLEDQNAPIEETASPTPVETATNSMSAPTAEAAPPAAPTHPEANSSPAQSTETAAASPNPAVSRPQFGVGKYTVSKGDTMFSIARKAELSLAVLSSVNNISDPSSVKVGQTLYIPAQPGSVYVAAKGDSVQSVADKYQTKTDAIREANRLDSYAQLEAGQLVLIPGVVQASAAIKPITVATPQSISSSSGVSPLPAPKSAQAPPVAAVALTKAPQGSGNTLIWPVTGPISTNFSPTHRGLDIVANQGVPVKSALAGRVVGAAEGDGPYGWYVIVEHGGTFTSVYAHLSKIRVKVGDVVEKSQIVGEVGTTGQSTGSHLHLELRQNNVPIDPRPYLP
jgi:murein DD-endopeptidase MepM/ murein hydrolase activator NlpD